MGWDAGGVPDAWLLGEGMERNKSVRYEAFNLRYGAAVMGRCEAWGMGYGAWGTRYEVWWVWGMG